MLSDLGDDRAGANPSVRGLIGIIIVQCAAGGVGAVERFSCGAAGRVGDRLMNLSVGDGGEGSGLIDNAGDAVGEGGGFHPVEHHSTDGDLTDIRFAPRLSGDDARQQLKVGFRNRTG